jgi:hypothetical protein
MPRAGSAPERASQHNAESLCAVGRRIGTAHRGSIRLAPAANCPPLSRPHNLHYVEMPAAQGKSLARLPLRELFDRDDRYEQQRTH